MQKIYLIHLITSNIGLCANVHIVNNVLNRTHIILFILYFRNIIYF